MKVSNFSISETTTKFTSNVKVLFSFFLSAEHLSAKFDVSSVVKDLYLSIKTLFTTITKETLI